MSDQPRLPEILVTSRPLENYLGFFDLDRSDLIGRRILDCPGGASSFTAEANNLGAFAVAVDPTYRATADELDTLGRQQIEYSDSWFRNNPDLFLPEGRGDDNITAIISARHRGLSTFVNDFRVHPEHYAAASLPHLPYPDGAFDLVLSSHLLFTYADRLDLEFHRRAIRELLRVSNGEVRMYPLSDYVGVAADWFDELLAELRAEGVETEVRDVRFRVTKNWTTQLIIRST